jgi:hypothetical protein
MKSQLIISTKLNKNIPPILSTSRIWKKLRLVRNQFYYKCSTKPKFLNWYTTPVLVMHQLSNYSRFTISPNLFFLSDYSYVISYLTLYTQVWYLRFFTSSVLAQGLSIFLNTNSLSYHALNNYPSKRRSFYPFKFRTYSFLKLL